MRVVALPSEVITFAMVLSRGLAVGDVGVTRI